MSASKGAISELVIVFIAVLVGVVLFTPISQFCYDAAANANTSSLAKVFINLVPFAYILIVFGVAIAVVIKILK